MIIIGERINTSRKEIDEAVERRDAVLIQSDVRAQMDAGAHLIDVNAGSRRGSEVNDLLWLMEVIQDAVPVRLSLDSSDPDCLLQVIDKVRDLPMINSTSAEKARFDKMVPLLEKRECEIVALCTDNRGVPKHVDQVLENAERLIRDLEAIGVKKERIYLDPVIQAVSTDIEAGLMALEAIERIRREFDGVKSICGLSNISYGLPKRSLINRTFLTLAMRAGLSASLIDPLDERLMGTAKATALLLGQDNYCKTYIKAFKEGKLMD